MLQGAFTAMITPFEAGVLDEDRLKANAAFQIEQGIDGLVPVGTTGESPTLNHDEHRRVIEVVVEQTRALAGDRVKVIAGTGSNSTSEALELTRHAKAVGADAALMVNPYYNKPTQEGLYRHFMAVADQVDLPIVLYNIPGRTGITMLPQTVSRLATHANICAVKEATGSLDIASEIASLCDLPILSGDDSLTLPLMSIGGRGVISVLSNLLPAKVKALTTAGLAGDFEEARKIHFELFELCKVMFIETNPIPIKTSMCLAGKDSGELRLPLCEMSEDHCAALEKSLRSHGVI
jgi:4-hydroxy-tetrahydrodipicolinate synthase